MIKKTNCPSCGGSGRQTCTGCGGSGQKRIYVTKQVFRFGKYVTESKFEQRACTSCGGSGRKMCSGCGGSGRI